MEGNISHTTENTGFISKNLDVFLKAELYVIYFVFASYIIASRISMVLRCLISGEFSDKIIKGPNDSYTHTHTHNE